jgi:hypothetical protein
MIYQSITLVRGVVNNFYVKVPDPADPSTGLDLTSYTVKAEVRDKPGGTLLTTLTCTKSSPPPGTHETQGWVKMSVDDGATIADGYRGTWSLLCGLNAGNYEIVAGGPADIISQPTA